MNVLSGEPATAGADAHASEDSDLDHRRWLRRGLHRPPPGESYCKRRPDVEIVLVSRDNFLVMTPLLFEVCSGTLDLRHCSLPIREFLADHTVRRGHGSGHRSGAARVVHVTAGGRDGELTYDHLVLASGP